MIRLTIALIFTTTLVAAQDTIPIPEFKERPYAYQDGKLLSLDKEDAEIEVKYKWGYQGADANLVVMSPSAELSLSPQDSVLHFLIKVEDGKDPSDLFYLAVESDKRKKGRRVFTHGKTSFSGRAKDASENKQDIEYIKITEGLYQIRVIVDGVSREYAFLPKNVSTPGALSYGSSQKAVIYCFKVL